MTPRGTTRQEPCYICEGIGYVQRLTDKSRVKCFCQNPSIPFEEILRRALKPGEQVTIAHLFAIEDYWHECQRLMEEAQGR